METSATERVRVVGPGRTYIGKQGFTYGAGASSETVGAEHICMNVLPMPDGRRANAHYHRGVETISYLLEGNCAVYYGENLECRVDVRHGEQIYIPADVPHAPSNESGAPCTWIVVHASGSDQDGIVLLPQLDEALSSVVQNSCRPCGNSETLAWSGARSGQEGISAASPHWPSDAT